MSIYRCVVRLKRINALVLIGITSVFVSCISNNSFIVCNASMSFLKGQGHCCPLKVVDVVKS